MSMVKIGGFSDDEVDSMVGELIMGWTPPQERMDSRYSWSQQNRGDDWELREYSGSWPQDPYQVLECISEEEFSRRFYWRSPSGEYTRPLSNFNDCPELYSGSLDLAFMVVDALSKEYAFSLEVRTPLTYVAKFWNGYIAASCTNGNPCRSICAAALMATCIEKPRRWFLTDRLLQWKRMNILGDYEGPFFSFPYDPCGKGEIRIATEVAK